MKKKFKNKNKNKKKSSSELKKNESFQNKQCVICSQPANGIHFGVISCEGCKVIFVNLI